MRAAARRPAEPINGLGAVVELAFCEIVGIDPCNERHIEPDGDAIARLAANIVANGLIHPLVVRGEPGAWLVLAGGCRFRALRSTIPAPKFVRCRIFDGDDVSARVFSIGENRHNTSIHPLDEADSVAALAKARNFGQLAALLQDNPRWVEERIRLARLPAIARAAWARGEIGLAQAKTLANYDAARIEALFAEPQAKQILSDCALIRQYAAPIGVSSESANARFVGLEAYLAAGGRTHSDMFPLREADREIWLDVHLLQKLVDAKLAEESKRIRESEGWGRALFDPRDAVRGVEPDFTAEEGRELDALRRAEFEGAGDAAAQHARALDIERVGALRKISKSDRAKYGVYVGLDSEGRLDVTRGVIVDGDGTSVATRVGEAASVSSLAEAATSSPAPRPPRAAAREPERPILHRQARRLADTAASRAAAEAIEDLSTAEGACVLVSALATGGGPLRIRSDKGPGGRTSEFLRELARLDFAAALAVCATKENLEINAALRALIALAVDFRDAKDGDGAALLAFLADSDLGLAGRFAAAFDYADFFTLNGRAVSLAAIRDCAGAAAESERAWMRDDQLAEEAARLARAKCWLPDYLRGSP